MSYEASYRWAIGTVEEILPEAHRVAEENFSKKRVQENPDLIIKVAELMLKSHVDMQRDEAISTALGNLSLELSRAISEI